LGQIQKKIKRPAWLSWQLFLVILVILIFVVVMIWSEPLANLIARPTLTTGMMKFTPTVEPGTPTPIPAELLESDTQTNGIILGAIILVLIIVIGSCFQNVLSSQKAHSSKKEFRK